MSSYTTGEIAKLCGVTVRTVQYYDTRGILVPGALTEGGRRLYEEKDVRRLKVICFLREIGLSIDTIGQLLAEEDPGSVILLLLEQQKQTLEAEKEERLAQLAKLDELEKNVRQSGSFSVESIGDIAHVMENKTDLKKVHRTLLLWALPIALLQWAAILIWIFTGVWWPFVLWAVLAIPSGILMIRWYYRRTAYICPQCHETFRPGMKEFIFSAHTPKTRKLTCPHCGHRGFCVEIASEGEV